MSLPHMRTTLRFLSVLLILAMCLSLFGTALVVAEPSSEAVAFTILHTNDFHGNLQSDSSGRGGAAHLAWKINSIRDEVG
ncbi:MAG: hypothetical protein GX605_09835, partial [Chloroflexi bacterium]|nr:hypothetical protein [Chloroflexota bacterium]